MRHRRHGRVLGRAPSHRKALYRNLVTALVLTEREVGDLDPNPPKVSGRIITTLEKAKEIRPLVEKCVTLAKKCRAAEQISAEFATDAERHSEAWKQWRGSAQHAKWTAAQAPAVAARRRLFQMLQDKQAVRILCDDLAERFADRPGGYTRILRLAKPRLGDAGTRAILEFVGRNDRAPRRVRSRFLRPRSLRPKVVRSSFPGVVSAAPSSLPVESDCLKPEQLTAKRYLLWPRARKLEVIHLVCEETGDYNTRFAARVAAKSCGSKVLPSTA